MEWVIDTNVLMVANDANDEMYWECVTFLADVLRSGSLVLDHESEILNEYGRRLHAKSPAGAWITTMLGRQKAVWYTSKRSAQVETKLDQLKFDRSDRKWIGVALNTSDRPHLIVNATDSDWTDEVKAWLKKKHNVLVVTPGLSELEDIAAAAE